MKKGAIKDRANSFEVVKRSQRVWAFEANQQRKSKHELGKSSIRIFFDLDSLVEFRIQNTLAHI